MLAPFATLLFLSVTWLVVCLIADMILRPESRVLSALRGETQPIRQPSVTITLRARRTAPQRQVLRARPQLRAAA